MKLVVPIDWIPPDFAAEVAKVTPSEIECCDQCMRAVRNGVTFAGDFKYMARMHVWHLRAAPER